jgi:hypothetical protein
MMHGHGKSDSPIVLAKPPNEAGPEAKEGWRKGTEERRLSVTSNSGPGSSPRAGETSGSKEDKRQQFTALLHHACSWRLEWLTRFEASGGRSVDGDVAALWEELEVIFDLSGR